ncbi:hypothetical protein GPECTOR_32g456 [Gonium pectorale]|uniref:Uncharacterized protein n=1 Tax=Gonium pectorale TaxID=33097 RepID=A0A150GDC9_GONPE|nr:hypothetical protein GPECTOR_32g456 [Gonium pectorale]|eukprot:KXZ47844.1 hypothetical protein GPECTOR_32g456 [Gonium pectorale]
MWAIVSLQEAVQCLWEAGIHMANRLAVVEAELSQLRRDADDSMLRSMARQTENKLYRHCRAMPPGRGPFTPVEVAQARIERLEAEQPLQKKGVYKSINKKFPNLGPSIHELRDQGDEMAHSWTVKDPETGQERPVTREDLQACINRRCANSIFKGDYENVLACLDFLATALGEPLFVPTSSGTPKHAPAT